MKGSILILNSLTAGILFLGALMVWNKPKQSNLYTNACISLFLLSLSFLFLQLILEISEQQEPLLIVFLESSRWLIFPFFYISLVSYIYPSRKMKRHWPHFIPFLIFLFLPWIHSLKPIPAVAWSVKYFLLIQAFLYAFLVEFRLKEHLRRVVHFSASGEGVNLIWMKWVYYALVGMSVFRLLTLAIDGTEFFVSLVYFFLTLLLVKYAFLQKDIYPENEDFLERSLKNLLPDKKGTARLTSMQVDLLKQKVESILLSERLYLQPSLNLNDLSLRTGINMHELSYVINEGFGKNFYQLINELRIEEAVRLLHSGKFGKREMGNVGVEAGFNSKTTFYAAMKKYKGKTPGQLLKRR